MSRGSINARSIHDIDQWLADTKDKSFNMAVFQDRLTYLGLNPYEVDIVCMRYAEQMSWKKISKEMGWKSKESAIRHHDLALEKLRKALE